MTTLTYKRTVSVHFCSGLILIIVCPELMISKYRRLSKQLLITKIND